MASSQVAWWRRPVGLTGLVWAVVGVVLVWGTGLAVGILTFYRYWQVGVEVQDQPAIVRLPAGVVARAEVDRPVDVHLKMKPQVPVDLNQTMQAELDQPLLARVKLQQTLPIDTLVAVQTTVPVKTQLHMKVKVRESLPAVDVDLPFEAEVPVNWQVPLRAQVPLNLDLLVSGQLRHTLQVPVRANWLLRPELDTTVHAKVQGQTVFTLQDPALRLPMRIDHALVRLPFDLGVRSTAPPAAP